MEKTADPSVVTVMPVTALHINSSVKAEVEQQTFAALLLFSDHVTAQNLPLTSTSREPQQKKLKGRSLCGGAADQSLGG